MFVLFLRVLQGGFVFVFLDVVDSFVRCFSFFLSLMDFLGVVVCVF